MNKKLDVTKVFTTPLIIVLGALLCCALWGSATPFIKMGYKVMFDGAKPNVSSTILFAGIRFAAAGFITVLLYSIARRKVLYPKKENLGKVAIIAAFQTVIQYFFFYVGLANTSGAKGTIISGSSSFFAIFISSLIFKQEKLTVKKVVACVVGFAGIIAVNLNGLDFSMNFTGDAFDKGTGDLYESLYHKIVDGTPMYVTPEMAAKVISVIETVHAQNPMPVKF